MTGIAEWLMVLSVVGPLLGAVVGLVLIIGPQLRRMASIAASLGIACSFLSATGLASILGRADTASWRLGRWLELTGPRHLQIEWGLRIDQSTAIWVAALSGLAGMTVAFSRRLGESTSFSARSQQEFPAEFSVTTALMLAATVGFVLSSSLVQMLACWTVLPLTTLVMVGWSSPRNAPVQGMRRAVQAGLPGDILLFWAVLWIGQVAGLNSIDDVSTAEGLTRLGAGNPALPGVIGCLMVLGILGRCGLFPCFGWHHEAAAWDSRVCIVVYGIGYVPSALWLLFKCHPLLTTAEAPLSLLGGLGTLAAVLGAFVACGQDVPFRRLAYLLSSQAGIMLAALGSGRSEAVPLSVLHQCSLSIAAFVLFASPREVIATGSYRRAAAWCAAFSVAGLVPLSGGWSQQNLIELNAHPIVWTAESPADEAESGNPMAASALVLQESAPHWGWICGMWLAQGLSAYAVVGTVRSNANGETGSNRRATGIDQVHLPEWTVILAALLLLVGGPCGWLLGFVSFPHSFDALARFGIGQSVAVAGLIAGWRAQRATSSNRWESITRLSQQRLYVDLIVERLSWPRMLAQNLANRGLGPAIIDRAWAAMIVRLAAWLGLHVESLQVERTDFYVATILLGTATLLLTLILVS